MQERTHGSYEMHAVLYAAGAVLIGLGLYSGAASIGVAGALLSERLTILFGIGAWLIPLFLLDAARRCLWGGRGLASQRLFALVMLCLACTSLHLAKQPGGRLGAAIGELLLWLLGAGAYVACAAAIVVALVRLGRLSPAAIVAEGWSRCRERVRAAWRAAGALERDRYASLRAEWMLARERTPAVDRAPHRRVVDAVVRLDADATPLKHAVEASVIEITPVPESSARPAATQEPAPSTPTPGAGDREAAADTTAKPPPLPGRARRRDKTIQLPTSRLLTRSRRNATELDPAKLKQRAALLETKLGEFGILGHVDAFRPGPVVTLYEFEPRSGTKLAALAGLSADLGMALQATVRIVAPLPGTARVGFEVALEERQRSTVQLREVVEDERWHNHPGELPLAIGVDIGGEPMFDDLAQMPHLLVAGATGTGKSVGLNAMLASLLMKRSPEQLRLILVDPKVVELAAFADIPHLLLPVVTETKHAARALRWAVAEMERRYELFVNSGARNLQSYNQRVNQLAQERAVAEQPAAEDANGGQPCTQPARRLPSIVIVIDEYADLSMTEDIEPYVMRLAQKARASGIHMIVATQRPSVDVITGVIKANFPARVAFKVAQREDSKTILGCSGAEHLLGRGDMLCRLPGRLEVQRVHGAFVGEDDVKALCDHLRSQGAPDYDPGVLASIADESAAANGGDGDALYSRALEHVRTSGICSTSSLQRALKIGYNKAAQLVERLADAGVVGPPNRRLNGAREVVQP